MPYKMSDWYGYSKNCVGHTSFSSSTGQTSESAGCSATVNQTYYHNGGANPPVIGDECYNDVQGVNVLGSGYYLTSASGGFRITGTAGTIASTFTCTTLTKIYATAIANKFSSNVCGTQVSVDMWHDGAFGFPGNGDHVYTNAAGTTAASWVGYKGFFSVNGGNAMSATRISGGVVNSAVLCP